MAYQLEVYWPQSGTANGTLPGPTEVAPTFYVNGTVWDDSGIKPSLTTTAKVVCNIAGTDGSTTFTLAVHDWTAKIELDNTKVGNIYSLTTKLYIPENSSNAEATLVCNNIKIVDGCLPRRTPKSPSRRYLNMARYTKLTIKKLSSATSELWITLYDKQGRERDRKEFGPKMNQIPLPTMPNHEFQMRHTGKKGYFTFSCFDRNGRQIFMQTKLLRMD